MKLDEKTKIPLGWVFALLSVSGSGLIVAVSSTLWFSNVANDSKNTAKLTEELRAAYAQDEKSARDAMQSIDRRLARIEGALGVKSK